MKKQEAIFAGFGGQGIQAIGKFLAYAGLFAGLNVSWLPSYGPEMRGGTSNCSVILNDNQIGSPIVTIADTILVMNKPSLCKFESYLREGGTLILNSDLVDIEPNRTDIIIIKIPADKIAEELGARTVANVVMLGAFIEATKVIDINYVSKAINENGKEKYYNINNLALKAGKEYAKVNYFNDINL